ncbi:hypothetical protein [Bacillus haynesii]|uniref:hypothetical protein n=1 Tax=Bacillus haynesii TaxID=1925021 RepID=UPI002280BE26|nr:hypothetical protein [Bacillus haynesii]MCY9153678.1 hypothetical protein [Bacillus haynesii]MEC0719685.1 hypothetical protein [Bacillus haynesii]
MIRRRRRRHLVVYYNVRSSKEEGDGRIFVTYMRKNRISPADLERIEEGIEREYGLSKVIITNYQYF